MEELNLTMGQSLALIVVLLPLVVYLWQLDGKPFIDLPEQEEIPAPAEQPYLIPTGQAFYRARRLN